VQLERARVGEPRDRVTVRRPLQTFEFEAGTDGRAECARSGAHERQLVGPPTLARSREQIERTDALVAAEQRHTHGLAQIAVLTLPRATRAPRLEQSRVPEREHRDTVAVERGHEGIERAVERGGLEA
jgi:hypothetical protein